MDVVEALTHWKEIIEKNEKGAQYDLTANSHWIAQIDNVRKTCADLENSSSHERTRELLLYLFYDNECIYAQFVGSFKSAIMKGTSVELERYKNLVLEMKDSNDIPIQWKSEWPSLLADAIPEKYNLKRLSGYIKQIENPLGEVFGKLHPDVFPVFNGCSKSIIKKLGYKYADNYNDFHDAFEYLKKDYCKYVGKLSVKEMHQNIEIDQMFNYFHKDKTGKDFLKSARINSSCAYQHEIGNEHEQQKIIAKNSNISKSDILKRLHWKTISRHSNNYTINMQRRDNHNTALLKKYHDFKCQICKHTIRKKNGDYYIEAAHITPKHKGGSELPCNIIILCPNHHKEFDHGKVEVVNFNDKSVEFKMNGTCYIVDLVHRYTKS